MPGYGRARGFLSSYDPFGYSGSFSRYGGYDFAAEFRRENERHARELARELQRQAAGSRRRQVELERFGKFVPAGEWDADCEAWPEKTYNWNVGSFYMQISRGPTHAWNGYVTLPEGYPHSEKHYAFWNGDNEEGYASGLPKPPVRELTYGNAESFTGAVPVGKFGFDHSWGGDRQPLAREGGPGNHAGCKYTTAKMAINEVWRLAAYFASLVLDGTMPTTSEWMAQHKESLLRIVEADMRIADEINKKRRAAAAEAARVTAEKAAAEAAERARLAAEAAERQRLWDEAHPEEAAIRKAEERAAAAAAEAQKAAAVVAALQAQADASTQELRGEKAKAARAQEKIREAEALAAREAAGETLLTRERRVINHCAQLEIELKNRLASISRMEEVPAEDFTARIAAAEASAAEAQAAANTAAAETTALKEALAAKQRAAEEARIAAENAAAAAAEREARLAPMRKRLPHVKQLLADIEILRARRAAGETLDPLQAKKTTRRQALEKELAELEKELSA
jgi:hypothetical protein